jgi:hypothetical protein
MGLTEQEVLFMVENETLELPRNFFRRLIKKSSKFTTLEYVGFRVRDLFPDNIIRLKDGRLKFVTHYETVKERDPATGVTKSSYIIHGYCFDKVSCAFYAGLHLIVPNPHVHAGSHGNSIKIGIKTKYIEFKFPSHDCKFIFP